MLTQKGEQAAYSKIESVIYIHLISNQISRNSLYSLDSHMRRAQERPIDRPTPTNATHLMFIRRHYG